VNESAVFWPFDLNCLHSLESFSGPSRLALLKSGRGESLERTQEQHIVRGVGFFQNSDRLLGQSFRIGNPPRDGHRRRHIIEDYPGTGILSVIAVRP
jgi:hypothetical protein